EYDDRHHGRREYRDARNDPGPALHAESPLPRFMAGPSDRPRESRPRFWACEVLRRTSASAREGTTTRRSCHAVTRARATLARVLADARVVVTGGPRVRWSHLVVTGGAGFMGSHLVDALLERGCEVTCVDDLVGTAGTTRNLDHLPG